jgi:hypothetical protein
VDIEEMEWDYLAQNIVNLNGYLEKMRFYGSG